MSDPKMPLAGEPRGLARIRWAVALAAGALLIWKGQIWLSIERVYHDGLRLGEASSRLTWHSILIMHAAAFLLGLNIGDWLFDRLPDGCAARLRRLTTIALVLLIGIEARLHFIWP